MDLPNLTGLTTWGSTPEQQSSPPEQQGSPPPTTALLAASSSCSPAGLPPFGATSLSRFSLLLPLFSLVSTAYLTLGKPLPCSRGGPCWRCSASASLFTFFFTSSSLSCPAVSMSFLPFSLSLSLTNWGLMAYSPIPIKARETSYR